jgi:hypothetical protein
MSSTNGLAVSASLGLSGSSNRIRYNKTRLLRTGSSSNPAERARIAKCMYRRLAASDRNTLASLAGGESAAVIGSRNQGERNLSCVRRQVEIVVNGSC